MSVLVALSTGRIAKWVTFAVSLTIVGAIFATNLPGKFADAERNTSTSFLPGDAESTKTLQITEKLNDGDIAPTFIVYRRDSGLTGQDKRAIVADISKLNGATAKYKNTSPFGNPDGPQAKTPFQLSADGTSALIANRIVGTGVSEDIIEPINDYRELVTRSDGGLEVKVTGPAGVAADAIKIFDSINGTLLAAALGLVIFLLILIYRSPIFWVFPLFAVVISEIYTQGIGYGITELGVTVNGQAKSLLSILVIGAGTDYALLLVARYREELRKHEDRHEAMAIAVRRAGPAIIASAATVSAALFTLTLAKVNGTAALGPIGAMGILVAGFVMLTFLPALLLIVGRKPFWPLIPHVGDEGADETHGIWRKVADVTARKPMPVAIGSTVVLAVMALGLTQFNAGLTQGNSFRDSVESIEGQALIAQAFPSGRSVPADILVPAGGNIEGVRAAVAKVPGIESVSQRPVAQNAQWVQLAGLIKLDPYSVEAFNLTPAIREAARSADPKALVGGGTAVEYDLRQASADDNRLIIPLALVVVFLILILLLRAVVAPLILIATVVLSFLAALGVGVIVFDIVWGFPGSDVSLILFSFVFLVALGVDYNIFLMTRAREEAQKHGTSAGMVRAVAVTGGVITAAGIVLAGTFAILGVLPLVFLTQIGFVVAFGVLLDTFLVRSVLVPALVHVIGPKIWWPSSLARENDA